MATSGVLIGLDYVLRKLQPVPQHIRLFLAYRRRMRIDNPEPHRRQNLRHLHRTD